MSSQLEPVKRLAALRVDHIVFTIVFVAWYWLDLVKVEENNQSAARIAGHHFTLTKFIVHPSSLREDLSRASTCLVAFLVFIAVSLRAKQRFFVVGRSLCILGATLSLATIAIFGHKCSHTDVKAYCSLGWYIIQGALFICAIQAAVSKTIKRWELRHGSKAHLASRDQQGIATLNHSTVSSGAFTPPRYSPSMHTENQNSNLGPSQTSTLISRRGFL